MDVSTLLASWQGGAEAAVLEHGQGDERVRGMEAVGLAGYQADRRIGCLDSEVRCSVLDARHDAVTVLSDGLGEGHELRDLRSPGPDQPTIEVSLSLRHGQLEDAPAAAP